jgi:diguanylate cyclase (GGDEF)-like protein/PAS domain S-box-containing protein
VERLTRLARVPGLGLALGLAGLAVALNALGGLQRIDDLFYDGALRLSHRPASADIVIVAIDERSLHSLGRWPWSRRTHAELIGVLSRAGARAIGLDVIFAEPDTADPAADAVLAEAIRANGHVVLPVLPEATTPEPGALQATLPLARLASVAAGTGHVDVDLDADGLARAAYLEAGIDMQRWASFPSMLLATGRPDLTPAWSAENRPPTAPPAAGTWWRDRRILIPFATSPRFRRLSYVDVLRGEAAALDLKDRFVLVGATAAGLGSRIPTPLSGESVPMSGVEFHAHVLNAGLQGWRLTSLGGLWGGLLTALLVFAPVASYRLCGPSRSILIPVTGMAATGAVSWALLAAFECWYGPSSVLLALTLSYPLWSWRRLVQAGRSLLSAQQRAVATLNSIGDAVIVTDRRGNVEYLNPNAELLTGFTQKEAKAQNIDTVLAHLSGDAFGFRRPSEWIASGDKPTRPGVLANARGEEYTVRLSANPIQSPEGEPEQIMIVLSDITETLKIGSRWQYLATHDVLTELPNRALLEDRIAQAIASGKRTKSRFAVLFVDLDGFKKVNDDISHAAGDFLLKEVAKRLRATVREVDMVARWGGDEFVVLLDRMPSRELVAELAGKMLAAVAQPYPYQQQTLAVTPNIGISLFPDDGQMVPQLLNKADSAMYRVKGSGRNDFRFYSTDSRSLDTGPILEFVSGDLALDLSIEDQAKLDAIRKKSAEQRDATQASAPPSRLKRLLAEIRKRS